MAKTKNTQNGEVKDGRTLSWQEALRLLENRVFKIRSPQGHGTGFHVGNFGIKNKLCAVATALHVVEESEDWGGPIKLIHSTTRKEILLGKADRVIFSYPKSDIAIIVFQLPGDFTISPEKLDHLVSKMHLIPGVDIGWCGFPGLRSDKLCFFHGYISCHLDREGSYLVDGVAINGVSGGPVFYIDNKTNKPVVAGIITAYIANRATKDPLPGVSRVNSIPREYEKTIRFLKKLPKTIKATDKKVGEQKLPEDTNEKPDRDGPVN